MNARAALAKLETALRQEHEGTRLVFARTRPDGIDYEGHTFPSIEALAAAHPDLCADRASVVVVEPGQAGEQLDFRVVHLYPDGRVLWGKRQTVPATREAAA